MPSSTTVAGTWSYSGNPDFSAKDQLRFLVGDTNVNDQQLSDQECAWLLKQYNNTPLNAAIRACETIISKLTRQADETVGPVKVAFSQKAKAYGTTLVMLRNRLSTEDAAPYCGGISISDKLSQEQNSDRVRPDFTKHMMENDQIAPWVTTTEHDLFLQFEG